MSRAERRALVDRRAQALSLSQQCRLLSVSRSSVYRRPVEVGEEDCTIMALIDRQYLARPYPSGVDRPSGDGWDDRRFDVRLGR